VANRIYDGIVDLLYQNREVSYEVLSEYIDDVDILSN
jgi:hypothetical protein